VVLGLGLRTLLSLGRHTVTRTVHMHTHMHTDTDRHTHHSLTVSRQKSLWMSETFDFRGVMSGSSFDIVIVPAGETQGSKILHPR